jgi:hypothetical protein
MYLDILYKNGDKERFYGEFRNGTHDYEPENLVFTPKNPILNGTFVIRFSKAGLAYFYGMSLQEQIPGNVT